MPGHGANEPSMLNDCDIDYPWVRPDITVLIQALQHAGCQAFLVGGSIRDRLLGQSPKDFDIATDARPDEVRRLFQRLSRRDPVFDSAHIVGRRFRIVHVRLRGGSVIEVSTFRAGGKRRTGGRRRTGGGRRNAISHHNVYGGMDTDARRRDFTINSLYCEPGRSRIYDFFNGLSDLWSRQIKIIGDPSEHYAEDPVRMLRMVRLAAKIGCAADAEVITPLRRAAPLLRQATARRLHGEMDKMFLDGYGAAVYMLTRRYGLFDVLFPTAAKRTQRDPRLEKPVVDALRHIDGRIRQAQDVPTAFLYAVLLMPDLESAWRRGMLRDGNTMQAYLLESVDDARTLLPQIPRKTQAALVDIWKLQSMLARTGLDNHQRIVNHRQFRNAWHLLRIRARHDRRLAVASQWWQPWLAERRGRRRAKAPVSAPAASRPANRPVAG